MKLITDITLELTGETKRYGVVAKQGDKATRFIRITLKNNGQDFEIPAGMKVIANIQKPDRKCCYNTCSYSGSTVTMELTNQALAVAGTAECDIEIRDANDEMVLSSQAFTIEIEKSMRDENAIESSNEFTQLEKDISTNTQDIKNLKSALEQKGLPSGGTTGQVLTKRSDTDGDATWVELSAYSKIEKISKKIFSGEIKKIILIGDSITDGYGGTGYNGNKTYGYLNTAGYCWANILKKYLSDRFQVETDNYGKYNSKIDEQFQIIQSNIISGNYDLCIWLSGTNNRVDSSTFQTYKTVLPQAINYLKDNIDDFVIISAIPATKDDEAGRGHKGYEIDEVALSSCVAENCCFSSGYRKFCDYIELTDTDITSCFSDHVHPNDLGYYILFKIICNILNLPLDPYVDYKIDGGYWEAGDPGGSEGGDNVLINTYNKGGQPFVEWGDGVIPVILTAGYDSRSYCTIYSGKTIKTIKFNLGESGNSGTITIGKLDLTLPRNQADINITEEMQYTIDSDGLVDLGDGITLGNTETLTIGREADTARLIYYLNATSDDNIMTCRIYAVESNQISSSITGIPIIVTI